MSKSVSPLELKPFDPADYAKAIDCADKGMRFDLFFKNAFLRKFYVAYFLYGSLIGASAVLAAYQGKDFKGVLIARMKGKAPYGGVPLRCRFFVKFIAQLEKLGILGRPAPYVKANDALLEKFNSEYAADGEILFLVSDIKQKVRGVGTFLLREFERREKGKRVYLFTDDSCTYQFYERRGFERAAERKAVLGSSGRQVALNCFLYSKVCGARKCAGPSAGQSEGATSQKRAAGWPFS